MNAPILDKRYQRDLEDLGTLSIRVVVVPRKNASSAEPGEPIAGEDDFVLSVGKSPVDNYLERHDGRGKGYVLFTLNGQRQDSLDQSFIARELEFRYLRNRTLVIIEMDGLSQVALDELLKGDRAGLFQGEMFYTVRKRVADTLKKDPDLLRLEEEAEEQVAELDSGTEAINKRLDELIEAGLNKENPEPIDGEPKPGTPLTLDLGDSKPQTVVVAAAGAGEALLPALVGSGPNTLRLRPDGERSFEVTSTPPEAWSGLKLVAVRVSEPVEELQVVEEDVEGGSGRRVRLRFDGTNVDEEQYPIETKVQVIGKFDGHDELRLVEKHIVISPPSDVVRTPKQLELFDEPTWIGVVSRQPIKLVPGGPLAHVRVKWNGKDELVTGPKASWQLEARCTTIMAYPPVTRTDPRQGRFELLIDTPRTLLAAQVLTFEVVARGPQGQTLRAEFKAVLEPPLETPGPGAKRRKVPEVVLRNQRPYALKLIGEDAWDVTSYWNKPNWDAQSVGAFTPPTQKEPLVLTVNKDNALLQAAKQAMIDKGLVEKTIEDRVNNYIMHVAYHLYSMYRDRQRLEQEQRAAGADEVPEDLAEVFMESEIARTANTILRLL
jgi:hypothetical protein